MSEVSEKESRTIYYEAIMTQLMCPKCNHVFWAAVIMGEGACPECGNLETNVAIFVEAETR